MYSLRSTTRARSARVAALLLGGTLAACGHEEPALVQTPAPPPPPLFDSGVPASRRAQDGVTSTALAPVAQAASPAPAAVSGMPTQAELATEGRAIGEKVMRAWAPPPAAQVLDTVIEVRVAVDRDGTVLAVRTVDEARMARDPYYKQWAESLEDAIVHSTPLPIPSGKYEQYKLMILPFNPRLVFGTRAAASPAGAPPQAAPSQVPPSQASPAEIRAVQEHVAKFWYPPPLSQGMRGQDFAVTIYVTADPDGTVREARAVDQTRVLQDPLYRLLAASAENAVKRASPLPVSRDGPNRQRTLVLNFVPDDE